MTISPDGLSSPQMAMNRIRTLDMGWRLALSGSGND